MAEFGISGSVDSPTLTSDGVGLLMDTPHSSDHLSEQDYQTAKLLWGMLQQGKKWKESKGLSSRWSSWWDDWASKQWKRSRPAGMSTAVINMLYETAETFVAHITDDIPEMVARSRHPKNVKAAQLATKLSNWVDDTNNLSSELEKPTRSGAVTGFGCRAIEWDETMFNGRGGVRQRFVDEYSLFFAPYSTCLQDAAWMIEAANVPVASVRNRWERGGEVKPGIWDGTLQGGPAGEGIKQSGVDYAAFTATDGSATQIVSSSSSQRDKNKDLCTLLQAWIRQNDMTLRYVVCANGIILQDGPSPYDDEEYPYCDLNLIPAKDHPYGNSLFMFIEDMQRTINEMHSYMLDAQKYESDSPLVVNAANIEEAKTLDNLPGAIYIDKTQGGGYQLLTKPGANSQYLNIQEYVSARMREISGNVDVLRGEKPAGVTTLGGMEIIRDEANVLVNKMAKHVADFRKRETLLAINRLRQFLKDERVIRMRGSNGKDQFVTVNERRGLDLSGEYELENTLPEDLEVDVDWTPTPPGGPQAQLERAIALVNAGAYDAQALLEAAGEDPEKIQAIMDRQNKAAEQAAQAEAVKSGAAPAPGQEDLESLKEQMLSQF